MAGKVYCYQGIRFYIELRRLGCLMKKVAIIQSNYIPWKGYFDVLASVDQFVLFDHVQFTRRDWRNRNKIKTMQGVNWLTIPVQVKGNYSQSIRDIRVVDNKWQMKHWNSICHAYAKSSHFADYRDLFADLYLSKASQLQKLSDINSLFMREICQFLGITTEFLSSDELQLVEGKNECLIDICKQLGAHIYVSGPAAKAYLDLAQFRQAGIEVQFMDYSNYPEYEQLHGSFEHAVSIIDLLFNTGPESRNYMKY